MIKLRQPALPLSHPAGLLATWFGSGLLCPASGTWGSLAALPFAWLILSLGGVASLLVATIIVFAIGCWSADRYEQADPEKDPRAVVIDEVAGQWLVLCLAPMTIIGFAVAFVLFRIFDAVKPWPVNWADKKLSGGFGIMADDIVAAVYPLLILWGLNHWGGNWFVLG